jgi:hypothetical protein
MIDGVLLIRYFGKAGKKLSPGLTQSNPSSAAHSPYPRSSTELAP